MSTRRNSASAANGRRGGRKAKPPSERTAWHGKVAIRISLDSAALAQRLMLHFPEAPNVASLYEYAMERLAETTDD